MVHFRTTNAQNGNRKTPSPSFHAPLLPPPLRRPRLPHLSAFPLLTNKTEVKHPVLHA